ncbi:hypothetical protein [Glaciecola sp. SC05]|uniref:hypothetical protein n=1 Tax=Glaciecola sp. SC05 TaxID=1987355 RepID=UPI0035285F00
MSNRFDDEHNEHQAIVSEAYQQLQKPMPTDTLDASILSIARQQAQLNATLSHPSMKSPWRKWQYSGSIAASVIFVALVFVVAEPEVNTDSVQSLPPANSEPMMADMTDSARERMISAPAQTQMQGLVVTSARRLASSLNTEAEETPPSLIDELFERILEIKAINEELIPPKKAMHTSPNEISTSQLVISNQKKSEQTKGRQALVQDDNAEISELQRQLFEALLADKQSAQNWVLDEKYKEVLTHDQLLQLQQH